MASAAKSFEYIVVGAGIMGLSAALQLSIESKSVLVIDNESPSAASRDVNKIVRLDYEQLPYMDEMRESLSRWHKSPFSPYIHRSGRVVVYREGDQLEGIKENRKTLGLSDLKEISPSEATAMFGGVATCPIEEGWKVFYNPDDLWVDLQPCLSKIKEIAKSRGTVFVNGTVEDLVFDDPRRCTGIKTKDGIVGCTNLVIVAVGAWTEKFLNKAKIYEEGSVHESRMPVATGVCVAHVKPENIKLEQFKKFPILSISGYGEILPPLEDGTLKITLVASFTNRDPKDGISVPGEPSEGASRTLEEEVKRFLAAVCPLLSEEERAIQFYWDGITTTQDHVIDYLPGKDNVLFLGGGSFHTAKFLPTLGGRVVERINGTLPQPFASLWSVRAGSFTGKTKNQPYLEARRDMHDMG